MLVNEENIWVVNLGSSGITYDSVAVSIKRPTGLSFEEVVLQDETYMAEATGGWYNIVIDAEYVDEPGTYLLSISHYSTTISSGDIVEKVEALPPPINSASNTELCLVHGNVGTVGGSVDPFAQTAISAVPITIPNITSGVITLGTKIQVYADHEGFFSLPLVKNMEVIIEVRDAGVRFQATIPDQPSISIEDLLPSEDPPSES